MAGINLQTKQTQNRARVNNRTIFKYYFKRSSIFTKK